MLDSDARSDDPNRSTVPAAKNRSDWRVLASVTPSAGPNTDSVAISVLSYLLSGPILFGGIGWGLDNWLGTSFLIVIGILGGMALSLYLIWFRYGTGV